jgi:aminoglycoside phosphotransferase (APT) family kinase protein
LADAGASSHVLAVIQAANHPRRFLLKGSGAHACVSQNLDIEARLLTEVAPRIAECNAFLECPRVLGYFREHSALLMELIDGPRLDRLMFGFASRPLVPIDTLIARCAQWLARFHMATHHGDSGHPVDRLLEDASRSGVRRRFARHGLDSQYNEVMTLLHHVRRAFPELRTPLSMIHGEFTPYHVLVKGEVIYVLDLASARPGHPYEDLSLFSAYCQSVLPWRRLSARFRTNLSVALRSFAATYAATAIGLGPPPNAIMSFASILAMCKIVGFVEARRTWRERLYYRVVHRWMGHVFRLTCTRELYALRMALPDSLIEKGVR